MYKFIQTIYFIIILASFTYLSYAMYEVDSPNDTLFSKNSLSIRFAPDQVRQYFQEAKSHPQNVRSALERLQIEQAWEPTRHEFKSDILRTHFSAYLDDFNTPSPEQIVLANVCYDRYLKNNDEKGLMEAAHSNHAAALYELSLFIKSDDSALGNDLLHRSAIQGNTDALYGLSREFLTDNSQLSKALCEEAAGLGHYEAQYALASAPLTGEYGSSQNLELAMNQIEQLANEGNLVASEALKSLKNMTPEEIFEVFCAI